MGSPRGLILFYDAGCRGCRLFARLALAADIRKSVRTAPLDSAEGDRHLGHLSSKERFGAFHLLTGERLFSGAEAVGPLLEVLPPARPLGRLIRRSRTARRLAAAGYELLSRNRGRVARVLPHLRRPSR